MSSDLAQRFDTDGFLTSLDVFTNEEVDVLLKYFLAYEERLGGKVTGSYR